MTSFIAFPVYNLSIFVCFHSLLYFIVLHFVKTLVTLVLQSEIVIKFIIITTSAFFFYRL